MEESQVTITPIARIRTPFKEKFGIPRQSTLASSICGRIVFYPKYRNPDAIRGIEQFSHLWLIFDFSLAHREEWTPTVRPPRLGGNTRVGVFASRSPFRPNPLGISSVKLESVEFDENDGYVLIVSGVDLLDNTPIFDIKPYIPYSDCHTDATDGYSVSGDEYKLKVVVSDDIISAVTSEIDRNGIIECLSDDPRPSYQNDPERVYHMSYAGYDIDFRVESDVLYIIRILAE